MTEAGTGKHLVLLGALLWVAVKEVKCLGLRGLGYESGLLFRQ